MLSFVAAGFGFCIVCTVSRAQCCDQPPTAFHDSTQQTLLGTSVDFRVVAGSLTVVAGSPVDAEPMIDTGSSSVLTRSACGDLVFGALLLPSNGAGGDRFGDAVAIESPPGEGPLVLVGSPHHDTQGVSDAGAVYVFLGATGTGLFVEEALLVAPEANADARFGGAVAVDGDMAVIGAPGDSQAAPGAGAAYVFVRVGPGVWQPQQTLLSPAPGQGDAFGTAVSIEDGVIVVGAPFADTAGSNAGAAYLFRSLGGTWVLEATLVASDPSPSFFGCAVALDTDIAVVVASHHGGIAQAGAAYVFRNNDTAWQQEQTLQPCASGFFQRFGEAVAASAGAILVGAPGTESSHLFRSQGSVWDETDRLVGLGTVNAVFGAAVALRSDVALVGAPGTPTNRSTRRSCSRSARVMPTETRALTCRT
jgi:hypothetical protein